MNKPCIAILACLAAACAQPIQSARPTRPPAASAAAPPVAAPAVAEPARPTSVQAAAETGQAPKNAQQLFDEALEFLETSQTYWGQGDIENAIAALDQAYSLILQADPGDDPELSRQQEDIRIMVCRRMLEIYASRHTAASGKYDAIPKIINQHVERELKRFSGPEKRFFQYSFKRAGKYRPMIVAALKAAGLPEDLSWLPLIESGFKVRALSPARALGLWQFIPSTGFRYGLKRNEWIDERMDPIKATRAAIGYLQELHRIFGDWYSVLAAYNCGENRILREIRKQNINYLDNFWDLYARLPKETAGYVPRFIASLIILKDPKKYGIELKDAQPALSFETAKISKQVKLSDIARALGIKAEVLERLNAELRHLVTPPAAYQLKLPKGSAKLFAEKLAGLPVFVPARRLFSYHRIKQGETLSHLARRYRTTVARIAKMNKIKTNTMLSIGRRMKVPFQDKSKKGRPVRGKKQPPKLVSYKVKKGDSIWTLAKRYRTTLDAIRRQNGLTGNKLAIGQELSIPAGIGKARLPSKTKVYKVLPGDSPYQISTQHNMKLQDFLRLNKLTPRSRIFPGQELLVTGE